MKYQSSTTSSCKDIGIIKSELVEETQFLKKSKRDDWGHIVVFKNTFINDPLCSRGQNFCRPKDYIKSLIQKLTPMIMRSSISVT